MDDGARSRQVTANGIEVAVTTAGSGAPVLLLHGFPHTRALWSAVLPDLARDRFVVAPDLRGLGGSTRAADGYDVRTLAADAVGVLDAVGAEGPVDVVAIDLGAPVALALAMGRPERVRRLVVIESLAGALPGAEAFLAAGPPWWFGFHGVPGLAETVLVGHEAEYLDFFLRTGTHDGRGVDPAVRDAFVAAYRGAESLHCAFEHYRALPVSGRQIVDLARSVGLRVPTLAIGAKPVGDALFRQLEPVADDLTSVVLEDCGHIVPLDRPAELLEVLHRFWR